MATRTQVSLVAVATIFASGGLAALSAEGRCTTHSPPLAGW